MNMDSGAVVLIVGANGGLGTSTTRTFLEAGVKVVGVARHISDSEFPNANFSAVSFEVSSGETARKLVDEVVARWGRLDALVHLAGAFAGGKPLEETDDAMLDAMLNVNFRSAFHMIRAALPQMHRQGSGRIVAIGSRAAAEPQALTAAYAASKAALVSLIRTVAKENANRDISANIVMPGTMDTPANRAAMPGADFSKWVQPVQVAKLILHLASDSSSQINGAVIPVYGTEA
jgi:NAD(P)-dependent dehydrogenase (short-subunit alcohol dehydrogenase family)